MLCGTLFLGSAHGFSIKLQEYQRSKESYETLAETVFLTQEETPVEPQQPADVVTPLNTQSDEERSCTPKVDFALLQQTSEDAIAWITQEGTCINYPVAQGDDNDYYLSHLLGGEENTAGCVFADFENAADFSDHSTILYGHDRYDGSMFSSLNEYCDQSYYEAHQSFRLETRDNCYRVEVIAAFAADPEESGSATSPWRIAFESDADYSEWLQAIQARSLISTATTATAADRVLMLSTCGHRQQRFLVLGKLIEQ